MMNKCCLCFNLRTGVLIIAFLYIISAVLEILIIETPDFFFYLLLAIAITSIIVIIGVCEEKPNLLWPFLILQPIWIIVRIIEAIIAMSDPPTFENMDVELDELEEEFLESMDRSPELRDRIIDEIIFEVMIFVIKLTLEIYFLVVTIAYYRRKRHETNPALVCVTSANFVESGNSTERRVVEITSV